jgi:hypothetical protein
LNQQALHLLRQNSLDEADSLLQQAQREIADSGIAHEPEVLGAKITTLNNMGCSAKRRGAHLKAVTCFETAMSLERHMGRDVSATTLINLSTALTAMGDSERACAVASECMAIVPKSDGPMRVVAMHNLAVARHCAGDKHAVSLMRKAHELAVQVLGDNHATTNQIRTRLYEWMPQAAKTARPPPGSRGQPVFAPAPPLTSRQAAARALRSLDFGTPDLPVGRSGGTARATTSGTMGTGSLVAPTPSDGMPQQDQVMAGATFTDGSDAPPSDKLPPLGTEHVVTTSARVAETPSSVASGLPPIAQRPQDQLHSSPSSQPLPQASPGSEGIVPPKRKKGEQRPPPHGFCRFAHDAVTKQPPSKVSFSDVKAEMRSAQHTTADGQEEMSDTRNRTKKEAANPFQKSVAARNKRLELEAAEERAFLARRAKQDEAEAKEKERQHKALLVALSRRTHAARIIQNRYRRWRANNKALLDLKRQQEQKDSVSRAKSVVNFAQKWLKRTAGKRLVARMTHTKSNFEGIDVAVRKLQRAWRSCHARITRRRLTTSREKLNDALVVPERETYAAMVVQTWYRQRQSVWTLRRRRKAKYLSHCMTIQRWIRNVFQHRRSKLSDKYRERLENTSAAKIQAVWRGIAARFRVSMLRFQRKIQGMRQHELRCIGTLQRNCRGGLLRRRLGRYARERVESHRRWVEESRRTEPPTVVGIERMSASATRTALDGTAVKPLRRHTYEEQIAAGDQHRTLELELAVEPARGAVMKQFEAGLSRRDIEMRRAAEMHQRDQERKGFMRARSAIVIQRALRRYFRSQTFGERQRFSAMRSTIAAEHVERNSATSKEAFERERRRKANDLARPIREERLALQAELADIPAPADFVDTARSIEDRQAAAAELRRVEVELAHQLAREKEALRQAEVRQRAVPKAEPAPEPVTAQQTMFLTHKQRKAQALAQKQKQQEEE